MAKTLIAPLDAIDCDLAAACAHRDHAWRVLVAKDAPVNRDAYAEACAEVDALLDMRYEIARAERIVRE